MNIHNVQFEASYGTSRQLPASDLPEIVFAGKSNVGKSSLINKFFNRKNLARVSGVPGKTTTVNFFLCDGVRVADLPGYGYARRSDAERRRWGELMEGYFAMGRDLRLIVQLLGRNRIFAVEDPSYEKIRRVYMANGVICERLRLGADGIRTDELSRTRATVLHVTPFHS